MPASLTRALGLALAVALGACCGCANKPRASAQGAPGVAAALPDLPEPSGVLGELRLSKPDATFRAVRELGQPYSSLLPASFAMLTATLLGLPPLSADSFDPDLPVVGLLMQSEQRPSGWLFSVHAVSGPELVAKLSTGDHAPFRASRSSAPGLTLLEPSATSVPAKEAGQFALGVFDNYLVVASSVEQLVAAGPYAARTLPRHPPALAPIALSVTPRALGSQVVPAVRGLWAAYRTRLAHSDRSDRSAHGGRAPDFGDPAQIILGADTLVESLLSLIDGAARLELDLAPFADRLEATLALEPEAASDAGAKLAALAPGSARALLTLPAETQFALGLARSSADRDAAAQAAGDDWVRLLGARLRASDAAQFRAVLADFELGRGSQTCYGFLTGAGSGAFLVADVADSARLKRAGPGLFGLLALPGVRAPLVEFLGQPRVSELAAPPGALPNVTRRKLVFVPASPTQVAPPTLSFAWLVNEHEAFAAASKDADRVLSAVVQSAHGAQPTLGERPQFRDAVQRIGDQAALFAFLDARLLFGENGARSPEVAPLFLAIGRHGAGAALRLEIAKPAVELAMRSAVGL